MQGAHQIVGALLFFFMKLLAFGANKDLYTCPRAICPNETVGAVPVCPPERPRSGVSMPKIHAWCAGG